MIRPDSVKVFVLFNLIKLKKILKLTHVFDVYLIKYQKS